VLGSQANFCNKRILVESYRKTSKHQRAPRSRFEIFIPHALLTFLRISDNHFMGKLTKACLSADIPLYKQQNKQIKKLFHDVGHSLPFANNCRKTVQKFGATE